MRAWQKVSLRYHKYNNWPPQLYNFLTFNNIWIKAGHHFMLLLPQYFGNVISSLIVWFIYYIKMYWNSVDIFSYTVIQTFNFQNCSTQTVKENRSQSKIISICHCVLVSHFLRLLFFVFKCMSVFLWGCTTWFWSLFSLLTKVLNISHLFGNPAARVERNINT